MVANIILDLNYFVTIPFTPSRFFEEMQGIADGSNGKIDYLKLRRVNYFPELIKASCSIVGVWGSATIGGKLYHLRALDWQTDAPIYKYASITIYEPSEPNSNTFANIGYLGMIGVLSAMSKNGISVGEKVMIPNDPAAFPIYPSTTYLGKPWQFVLRDTI